MVQNYEKTASCKLEQELFSSVFEKTPEYIKKTNLINLDNPEEFSFILKTEHLQPYDETSNPEGLNLWDWFNNYEKEAKVSTAGIRGPQNILFPQDTRFPINLVGITLATVAKALVAKQKFEGEEILKLAAREVRYNSDLYLEAIARIQAACGIKTMVPVDKKTIPIWMASFLAFKLGLAGAEYITSSHGISVKNATKDLNSQGSQYLPEESIEFVNKIREIFNEAEQNGSYEIKFSSADSPLIDQKIMKHLNDGVDLYVEYLKSGVAQDINIKFIQNMQDKIIIENVGGCAYRTLSRVLEKLNISDSFNWSNTGEDPFFHSIGKYNTDSKGNNCFYDYSVDATVVSHNKKGENFFPVIESLNYKENLKNHPINSVILITDPDHDRLTVAQIESTKNIETLKNAGIDYLELSEERVLAVYSANQAFLMLMDFWSKQLKNQQIWSSHPRFMIKTTASALSWDEWARNNDVKVVNVPVGFKEIANIMKKVEYKLKHNPNEEVILDDVFANPINLGINPRLIFAGEESGGMIIGSEKLITSEADYAAVAMREKSATEAIILASALAAKLEKEQKPMSQNLIEVFEQNNIKGKFDTREDISYYNESEPDILKLKANKTEGEKKRTKNDLFYLTLAIAVAQKIITLDNAKEILSDTFKELDFSNLKKLKFVGDGTYFEFDDKFVEIRPSGTDAKTKAYAAGLDKNELQKYTKTLGYYSGERTELYNKYITEDFYQRAKDAATETYLEFVNKDANTDEFKCPKHRKILKITK